MKIQFVNLILLTIAHIILKELIGKWSLIEVYSWTASILKWGRNLYGRHELLPLDVLRNKILKTLHYWEIIEIVSVIVIFLDLWWIVVKVLNFIWNAALKIVDLILVMRIDWLLAFILFIIFIFQENFCNFCLEFWSFQLLGLIAFLWIFLLSFLIFKLIILKKLLWLIRAQLINIFHLWILLID